MLLVRQWHKGRIPNYRPTWTELHLAGLLDREETKLKVKIADRANTIKVARG